MYLYFVHVWAPSLVSCPISPKHNSLIAMHRTNSHCVCWSTGLERRKALDGVGGIGSPFIPASHLHCNSPGSAPNYRPNINALSVPATSLHLKSPAVSGGKLLFLKSALQTSSPTPPSDVQPLWCLIFSSLTSFLSSESLERLAMEKRNLLVLDGEVKMVL